MDATVVCPATVGAGAMGPRASGRVVEVDWLGLVPAPIVPVDEVAGSSQPAATSVTTAAATANVSACRTGRRITGLFKQAGKRLTWRHVHRSKVVVHRLNRLGVEARRLTAEPVAQVVLGAHMDLGRPAQRLHRRSADQHQHGLRGHANPADVRQPTARAAAASNRA